MNLDDGFFKSEVEFVREPSSKTLADEHPRTVFSSWPIRMIVLAGFFTATLFATDAKASDARIMPLSSFASDDQSLWMKEQPMDALMKERVDTLMKDAREIISRAERDEPPLVSTSFLERARIIVSKLDLEKEPPSDAVAAQQLAFFIASSDD